MIGCEALSGSANLARSALKSGGMVLCAFFYALVLAWHRGILAMTDPPSFEYIPFKLLEAIVCESNLQDGSVAKMCR